MNIWIRRVVTCTSVAGALALLPSAIAFANQDPASSAGESMKHGHFQRGGLLGESLTLDSLTAEQRSAIEQLVQQRRAAGVPAREADARVLVQLAQQVEQASIDAQALAPNLAAEGSAAAAQSAVERDTLNRLHALLTPAQRNQLVDRVEAEHKPTARAEGKDKEGQEHHPRWGLKLGLTAQQKAQIHTNLQAERGANAGDGDEHAERAMRHAALEAFRGDSFDASALVHVERRGEHAEKLARAMVPVLSPAQRATLANQLRARAAHETHS
jgi:Spy/CpxP family protein refolding chaperone